jgi:NDP-sugar pyrophosphorylase family protein
MNLFGEYCPSLFRRFEGILEVSEPWLVCRDLASLLEDLRRTVGSSYDISGTMVIHRTAVVHPTAILAGVVFVEAGATVGPHALLRDGAYIGEDAHVGSGVEIKQSLIGPKSAVAHLNYVGNSVVGEDVNIEAGAVLANHFNEKVPKDREIHVQVEGKSLKTGVTKFGALVGDRSRIGANAVTSPGTLLVPGSIVGRLALVAQ